jgi:hypothetical protein
VSKKYLAMLVCCLALGASANISAAPFERNTKAKTPPPKVYYNGIGLSLGAGNYNGVIVTRRLWDDHVVQGMIGLRLFTGQLITTFDYTRRFPKLVAFMSGLSLYLGGGMIAVFADEFESLISTENENSSYIGARFPLGAAYEIKLFDLPMDMFLETDPGILLVPAGVPTFGMSIGARLLY